MGLFNKSKRKKKPEEILGEYSTGRDEQGARHKVQHEALTCCEQLIELTRELEEAKKEYRMVTDYLGDIQILEDLPEDAMDRIRDSAQNIQTLNQTRESMGNKERKISEAQFAMMEQMEDELPNDIRRMQTNESYQSMIRRDMDNLEGEKSEWGFYLEAIQREQKLLKIGLFILIPVFIAGIGVLWYFQYVRYRNVMMYTMMFIFVVALLSFGCFLRIQYNRRERVRANASINRAITLSNQMKAKYVNVTNAVEYASEKFHVRNSMELAYLWEQYLEEAKERETVMKTDEDLEYFSKKLVRDLRQYKLYDAAIWVHQVSAILDKREMVEVKHYMLVRRQKLRGRMEQQIEGIQGAKRRMLELVRNDQEHKQEILEVLRSVDRMCGVS